MSHYIILFLGFFSFSLFAEDVQLHTENGTSRSVAEGKAKPNPEVMLSVAGKGYAVGWDTGVIQALYQNIPALREKPAVFTGCSSGSVLAAYLSCYGLSDASIKNLTSKITQFNKYLVNDHEKKGARVLLHRPTEYPIGPIKEVIENLIPDEMEPGKVCQPRFPTLIVAANAEILHTGKGPSGGMGRNRLFAEHKKIDDSFNVYGGRLRNRGQELGKACTYFVDKTMFEKLKQIPYEQRNCDLRLMETAADLRSAVYASVSEPTLFPWFSEQDPSKLLTGAGMGNYAGRMYNGGYPMLIVGGEDIKRVMPELYTISTGRPPLKEIENKMLKHWYTLNANEVQAREKWFNDAEISIPADIWDDLVKHKGSLLTSRKEIDQGYQRAIEIFKTGDSGSHPNTPPRNGDLHSIQRGRGLSSILDRNIKNNSNIWYPPLQAN